MRTLIVDDDVAVRVLVRDALAHEGIEVEEATSVATALTALRHGTIEDLDEELTQRVQALPRRAP